MASNDPSSALHRLCFLSVILCQCTTEYLGMIGLVVFRNFRNEFHV